MKSNYVAGNYKSITKAEVLAAVVGAVGGMAILAWAFNRALNLSGF